MQLRLLFVLAVLSVTALAGCGGKATTVVETQTLPAVNADKGAITGLVLDDRYRVVPDATVLLTPLGLTAKSDDGGRFSFGPLDPGAYVLLVNSKDHEAAPKNVDVAAGKYTEVEVEARRTFSQDGFVITTQFSIFIDCSEEAVIIANSGKTEGVSCMMDQSGDSARASFDTTFAPADANLTTYMVTEALANLKGSYSLVVGTVDSTDSVTSEYADYTCIDGTYARVQMQANKADTRPGESDNGATAKWKPAGKFTTLIFPRSSTYTTIHGATGLWGAGVVLGFKAKIVQSTFLGPPTIDVGNYTVLKPSG
ncbi:MAG: carboxypeptidase-like regulatory domain-containing protein [bacterium]